MQFYQFKIRHKAIRNFLARIKVIRAPKYLWYRVQKKMVIYIYTICWKWKKEQKKLSRELGQLDIR